MSDIYQLQFDRVAERLALKTLRTTIANDISLPIEDIYLQSPPFQYVNTRTETTNKLEEARYPSLAIYSVKENVWSPLGNMLDLQAVSSVGGSLEKFFESKLLVQQTLEFCLETTTKKDFMDYKQRLINWFGDNKTLRFIDDTMPTAGSMAIILLDMKDYTIDTPYETNFTVEVNYRLYKEYLAYAYLNYELYMSVKPEESINDSSDDNQEQWWSNLNPYTP